MSDSDTSAKASASSAKEPSLLTVALSGAIALAKEGKQYNQATAQFEALLAQVQADSPATAPLLEQLWEEFISAQRSAAFWQTLSDAEKELSDKMSESNIQLKQNYMRLVQEQ
ncbi:MAG: hypothetical protein AAFQ74_00225 [Cyanobacteria bacterium J06623_4]